MQEAYLFHFYRKFVLITFPEYLTLYKYLKDIGDGSIGKETPDCSVINYPDIKRSLVSTTDFFYPIVDDPYVQGEIACANVLSDLYAMGITRVDHMLMILGVSMKMTEKEQEISTREMIRGFNDKASEAGTIITGGQSVRNEFPMIGGVANSVVAPEEFILPKGGQIGDVLILTKPLGFRVVVNLYLWYKQQGEKWNKAKEFISAADTEKAYDICCDDMAFLNKYASELMLKYQCHGATDITGFGLLGHAKNLAEAQAESVSLRIHTLPIIGKMIKVQDKVINYKLLEGFCPETSGGLMMMIPRKYADDYLSDFLRKTNREAWIIGEVVKGDKKAFIDPHPKLLEVEQPNSQTMKQGWSMIAYHKSWVIYLIFLS